MNEFSCKYDLDQRPNGKLVHFNQGLYRLIAHALGDSRSFRIEPDGLPNAVEYYLLYISAVIYGAADAALTLILHNLGREAGLQERQIFECWVRAAYYTSNPSVAELAMRAVPFQEKRLLDDMGCDPHTESYQELSRLCEQIEERVPGAKTYREPSVRSILRDANDEQTAQFYASHYRFSSRLSHGSFAAAGSVIDADGIRFDSRLPDPNVTLEAISTYLLAFLDLLASRLDLEVALRRLPELKNQWFSIQQSLHSSAEERVANK